MISDTFLEVVLIWRKYSFISYLLIPYMWFGLSHCLATYERVELKAAIINTKYYAIQRLIQDTLAKKS